MPHHKFSRFKKFVLKRGHFPQLGWVRLMGKRESDTLPKCIDKDAIIIRHLLGLPLSALNTSRINEFLYKAPHPLLLQNI